MRPVARARELLRVASDGRSGRAFKCTMACRLAHLLLSTVCASTYHPVLEAAARTPANAGAPSAVAGPGQGPGLSGAFSVAGASAAGAVAVSTSPAGTRAQTQALTLAVPGVSAASASSNNALSLTGSTGAQLQSQVQAQLALSMKRTPSAVGHPATLPTLKRVVSQKAPSELCAFTHTTDS